MKKHDRIQKLKNKIDEIYGRKDPNRQADWTDWLYQNHIYDVAEKAEKFAKFYGANVDIVVAASMLHDIADAIMKRENPNHENESTRIAREFLEECNFTFEEINIIINDAVRFHGCKNGEIPKTLEGKVVATADAVAHLKSDFYKFSLETLRKTDSIEEIKDWALPKIERDFYEKIFFDEIRDEVKADYEKAKNLFLNLEEEKN